MSMASYPFMLWGAFLIDEEVAKYMECDSNDFEEIMDCYDDDICRVGQFDGTVETTLPHTTLNPIYINCYDDTIYYIPAQKPCGLFAQAYDGPLELEAEHKNTLKEMGVHLPDDFDWWSHIVDIIGTYFG